ncbi:MAG: NAD kinase, partial [uncultured Acetobacteraceae bacterium]
DRQPRPARPLPRAGLHRARRLPRGCDRGGDGGARAPRRALRGGAAGGGRGHHSLGRRRQHAGDAAPAARPQPAGLRDELRQRRLPDERPPGREPAPAPGGGASGRTAPLAHVRDRRRRQRARSPGDQRGLAAARNPASGQNPHPGRRQGAVGGADLRRRAGVHPRRQHRLQPLGARADRAAQRRAVPADAHLRLPAAALARRAAALRRPGGVRNPGSGQAPRRRRRGLHGGARHPPRGGARGPLRLADHAVRPGPRAVGTDHRRAVHRV